LDAEQKEIYLTSWRELWSAGDVILKSVGLPGFSATEEKESADAMKGLPE